MFDDTIQDFCHNFYEAAQQLVGNPYCHIFPFVYLLYFSIFVVGFVNVKTFDPYLASFL